jgi:hypothetical protein
MAGIVQGQQPNKLMSLGDLDIERWKPKTYGVSIDVPVTANGMGSGSITLNDQPIFITRIAALIVGNTMDPATSGLYQDGQFKIAWRDDLRTFQNVPILADLLWGPKIQGDWRSLEYPLYYMGTQTLLFELYNTYARTLSPTADTYEVQIALSGLADWGAVQSGR